MAQDDGGSRWHLREVATVGVWQIRRLDPDVAANTMV